MNNYSEEVMRILKDAEREMLDLRHPYVGTEHLLLSLLKQSSIQNICSKYNLTYDIFKKNLINIVGKSSKKSDVILYTPLLRMVLEDSKNNKDYSDEVALFSSLLSNDEGIALRILMLMGIDIDSLYNDISKSKNRILLSIGKNLNDISTSKLIGRDKELDAICEILLRKIKNNPLLIGEAGVGKSAIVYELARRIKEGRVPTSLLNYKIISIDMSSLLSNTKYRGEFETKINNIINEIKGNGNIILFIDEIHTIIKSGGGESSVDAANILKPYLASDEIKIIGATTINEYEHSIAKDKALSRRFMCVNIDEPSDEETKNILLGVKSLYEDHHKIKITSQNIDDIIYYSSRYITNNHNPDKSLDVLDYVCSRVSMRISNNNNEYICNEFLKKNDYKNALKIRKKNKDSSSFITKEDIQSVIESICNIKLLDSNTYDILCHELDNKIFGQDLTKVKNLFKRKLNDNRLLSMRFNGIEGVGKRYTAKVIADTLRYNYLELDMKEFMNSTSINRIIGADPGYVGYDDDKLLDKIKYHPYTLLFLDNYMDADIHIKNLFVSIIKKGYIRANNGDIIDFTNTIIIMSTNIKKKHIGYIDSNIEDNDVIEFNKIDKTLFENDLKYKEILKYINDKTTFRELNNAYNKYIYNS